MQRLRLLSATLALVAVASFPAQPADDVKAPPAGYRHQPKKDQDYVYSTYIP